MKMNIRTVKNEMKRQTQQDIPLNDQEDQEMVDVSEKATVQSKI